MINRRVLIKLNSLFLNEIKPRTFSLDCTLGKPIVSSFNEWDPLEEIILGRIEGATIPEYDIAFKPVTPAEKLDLFKNNSGQSFPLDVVEKAKKELDYFARVLESEGVTVRRPEVNATRDFCTPFKTPDFSCKAAIHAAMPRDSLLVVGNEIIEAPMSWRSRYFEFRSFRSLMKEYFNKGAKWTVAPKPQLCDELYAKSWESNGSFQSVITEFEPVFDAAEFTRFGKDIFCQQSHATNKFGIEWLRRHLGSEYNIHVLDFQDEHAIHIDATFVPLMPGKLLVNPKLPCVTGVPMKAYKHKDREFTYRLPEMFKGWDILVAPQPEMPSEPLYFTSPWIATVNVLVLRPGKVVVEAQEKKLQELFKEWGIECVSVPFRNVMPFGGSFHCTTCDIRRTGSLKSYF